MSKNDTTTFLKDYAPHPFKITHSNLTFDLDWSQTKVTATHQVERQNNLNTALVLDCEKMEIHSVAIDRNELTTTEYSYDESSLTIHKVPDSFELTIQNQINPSENTRLMGLYRSGDMLCTQCEAEGFCSITPAIDRPDNLATYTVTLKGNPKDFPILLCNGNSISEQRSVSEHSVNWEDPFPKPTYLFAIVAGSLSVMKDTFTTMNNRKVDLHFYARDRDIEKCEYAVGALKRSMRWDEEAYGREYDLDLYNIVAVSDFNMGAMENKSLNVFNTKYVLATPDIATDTDFENVERVIGHEYFHNWSGNRVTCRDWFQLSLKEGFTVFRDQEFGADMGSQGVSRIDDINALRNRQFPEDAGPMAHPVRPDSYKEINNFYTVTIYEKGAEVVRMLRTIVGYENFRKGTDLYFKRHDGEAVTTDDFVAAISDASNINLTQFKNWYSQAGTPNVSASFEYDDEHNRYSIHLTQSCPPTPDQATKQPFVIPIVTALLDNNGNKLNLGDGDETTLILKQEKQTFIFENISEEPTPSLLRGFSSPVKLNSNLSNQQQHLIALHDDDPFNRWEAIQQLFQQSILNNISRIQQNKPCIYDAELQILINQLLTEVNTDRALFAKFLTLPGESWLGELSKPIDPLAISEAHHAMMQKIAADNHGQLVNLYELLQSENNGTTTANQIATRSLRDVCLSYLTSLDTHNEQERALQQLKLANNITDRISALSAIASSSHPDREKILEQFYQDWKQEELIMDKWFRIQATAKHPDVLSHVENLCDHPAFDDTNPNKIYSLILAFCYSNTAGFNAADGKGYAFLTQWVKKLDPINPQVTSRLVSAYNSWRDLIPSLGEQMQHELQQIKIFENLSPDVEEIVTRALG